MSAPGVAANFDALDARDLVDARHKQVQAVLSSLLMSFESSQSFPGEDVIRNTIWAAQELLEQAQGAMRQINSAQ